MAALSGSQNMPLLNLHDRAQYLYNRENGSAIGSNGEFDSGKTQGGRTRMHRVCGALMHSSLVVTLAGLPLALAEIKF
jgi:hypothetical protein